MSYTPNEWQTGDVVTAQKLNHLENGIANAGVLIIRAESVDNGDETYSINLLDGVTLADIWNALKSGRLPVIYLDSSSILSLVEAIYEEAGDGRDEDWYGFVFNQFAPTSSLCSFVRITLQTGVTWLIEYGSFQTPLSGDN